MHDPPLRTKILLGLLGIGIIVIPFALANISERLFSRGSGDSTPQKVDSKNSPSEVAGKEDNKSVAKIDLASLISVVDKSDTLIIDIRDQESYQRGHITNAINLPAEDISKFADDGRLESLKKDFAGYNAVFYCEKNCSDLYNVTNKLGNSGFNIYVFEPGYEAWLDAKQSIEK